MDATETKKVVRVSIFNQNYTLTSSGDPRDTELLAQEIDELMSSIARKAGNLDSTRTAVLACLHLADRLKTAETELKRIQNAVDTKSRDFSLMLDEAFSLEPHSSEPHSSELPS